MTETLIDSFGAEAVLEGEGLSVVDSMALVHLWDSLSIWEKGLGVFDAWVYAGVHGTVL